MPPEDTSKVDRLDDTLYSKTRYKNPLDARSAVGHGEAAGAEPAAAWDSPGIDALLARERKPSGTAPFMKKFFIFASLFFAATLVVAGFVFFGGANFISSKNVDLKVIGPTEAQAGQPVELEVTIENANNADLELAVFSVQYPTGAKNPADSAQTLTFTKEDLGVIEAGHHVTRNVKLLLIGQAGEQKEIKFSLQYKVSGSNATFYKDKMYDVTLGNSPLSLTVSAPESVTSGEGFTTTISITQNSTEVLKNVMLRAEYPYGYRVTEAAPAAFADNNIWSLGDLSPGAVKKISIRGTLTGENKDERTFRVLAGVAEGSSPAASFKNILLSAQDTVTVERPSIDLTTSLNGEDTATYVAPAGQGVNASVRYKNNLPEKLRNPKLEVRFAGSGLDRSSITASNGGFYDSGTNSASWNVGSLDGSNELPPGDTGSVTFHFASLADVSGGKGKDITLEITLSGTTPGNQLVKVTDTRTVKLASQVSLTSRILHSTGVFQNTGPIPPQAEKETTYTAYWSVGNTTSDLSGTKLTAKLGSAVKWKGAKSADSENITYNENTNTVTWDVGTLASGTGFTLPGRNVSFQVGITPSLSQVGTTPSLVTNIVLTGFDSLAAKTVAVNAPALTTNTPNDPAFIQGDGIVVK